MQFFDLKMIIIRLQWNNQKGSWPDLLAGLTIHKFWLFLPGTSLSFKPWTKPSLPILSRAWVPSLGRLKVSGTKSGMSGNFWEKLTWSVASLSFRHKHIRPGSRLIFTFSKTEFINDWNQHDNLRTNIKQVFRFSTLRQQPGWKAGALGDLAEDEKSEMKCFLQKSVWTVLYLVLLSIASHIAPTQLA